MQKREEETGDLTLSFYFLSFFLPPSFCEKNQQTLWSCCHGFLGSVFIFWRSEQGCERQKRVYTEAIEFCEGSQSLHCFQCLCVCAYSTS